MEQAKTNHVTGDVHNHNAGFETEFQLKKL